MKAIKFIIAGETPAKKNSRMVLPNGRNIPSKHFREWHELALLQLRSFFYVSGIKSPLNHEIKITLNFTHGDKRRRDSDNGTSSILDLLQDAGVLEDDCWQIVREINVHNFYEKDKAKCEILIEDYKYRSAIDE